MTAAAPALVLGTAALTAAFARTPEPGAAEPVRIVVMTEQDSDALALRLGADLLALGFEVVAFPPPSEPPSREPLEDAARAASAVAAVRIVPTHDGVEVWIADRVTGKTVLRQLVSGGGATSPETVIALRTVELLRASLMELQAPAPPRGEVAVPPPVRALVEPDTVGGFSFDAGPGLAWSPGGLPAFLGAQVVVVGPSLHGRWMRPTLRIDIPTARPRVTGGEGFADLALSVASLGLRAEPLPSRAPVAPAFEAGIAGLWLRTSGVARAPFAGSTDDTISVAPYVGAGLGVALATRIRLRADALVGISLPRQAVMFVDRDVGTFGRPFVLASTAIEIHWP